MTPEMRKRYDEQEQERMEMKERLFEHLKFNMNQDRPSILLRVLTLITVWDVQWDKLQEPRTGYPAVRSNTAPPKKKEGKGESDQQQKPS